MTDAPQAYAKPNFDPLDPAAVVDSLSFENEDLLARVAQLLKVGEDWKAIPELQDEQEVEDLNDFLAQVKKCCTLADERRDLRRRPYTTVAGDVQKFFKENAIDKLDGLVDALRGPLQAYLLKKRERDEAEKKRLQEEAARIAASARTDEDLAAAKDLAKRAETTGGGVKSVYGSASNLRSGWDFRVIDIAQVPPAYLTVDEKKVRAVIKGKNGVRKIPGLEIFETLGTSIRKGS